MLPKPIRVDDIKRTMTRAIEARASA